MQLRQWRVDLLPVLCPAAYGLDIAAAPEDMDIIYADAAHDYAGSGYNVRCV